MKNLLGLLTTVGFFGIVSSLPQALVAQGNSAMQVDVTRCVAIINAAERHECFDEITAHLRSDSPQSPVTTVIAPSQAKEEYASSETASTETTVREFGLESSGARVTSNDDGEAELIDTIADLEERQPGRWLITLESGQVWSQDTTQQIRLRKGMSVRIYPSSFGNSYRLAVDEINGVIQVRRIK
ncbi:MAG: hypothetical protein V4628_06320 [Pseudomonadota bacterium]